MMTERTLTYSSNFFPSIRDLDRCRRFEILLILEVRPPEEVLISDLGIWDLEMQEEIEIDSFPEEERIEIQRAAERWITEHGGEILEDAAGAGAPDRLEED